MSHTDAHPADDRVQPGDTPVETVIIPRSRDIGAFEVRRALPTSRRKLVGPFIFFDQMGPAELLTGEGMDVRPHPHIGLATVTYLLDGEIIHKDSLGTDIPIHPGAVNWMTAGRGIVHSERTDQDARRRPGGAGRVFGLQAWVALPQAHEERAPAFAHYSKDDLPTIEGDGARVRLINGQAWGARSPVETLWDTLYADIVLDAGARLDIPTDTEERALYVLEGAVDIAGDRHEAGRLLILRPGDPALVSALTPVRMMLLGGATMDGPRYIWWNFVSSSKDRIEQAKADWKAGRFDRVVGDNEFIPLPDDPGP